MKPVEYTNLQHFYLRPVWAFRYYHCLCLSVFVCVSVCVCVNPKFVCTITLHPFKLEPPKPDKRCKTPWLSPLLFGVNWPWPLRSNLTEKSKFTPFRACPPLLWCQIQMSVSSLSTRVLVSLICEYLNEAPLYPWIKYFAFIFSGYRGGGDHRYQHWSSGGFHRWPSHRRWDNGIVKQSYTELYFMT